MYQQLFNEIYELFWTKYFLMDLMYFYGRTIFYWTLCTFMDQKLFHRLPWTFLDQLESLDCGAHTQNNLWTS